MRDCGHDGPWEAPSVLVSSVASFCSARWRRPLAEDRPRL